MEAANAPPTIAILNSSEDLLELLSEAFGDEGFRVVTHHLIPFRLGHEDVAQFFAWHRPEVVIWELSIPYDENWAFFRNIRQTPSVLNCPVILTSTNVTQLRNVADPAIDAFEVVSKPFDLNQLIDLVRQALGNKSER
jgi:DNA-binding NtrC family response regulator